MKELPELHSAPECKDFLFSQLDECFEEIEKTDPPKGEEEEALWKELRTLILSLAKSLSLGQWIIIYKLYRCACRENKLRKK